MKSNSRSLCLMLFLKLRSLGDEIGIGGLWCQVIFSRLDRMEAGLVAPKVTVAASFFSRVFRVLQICVFECLNHSNSLRVSLLVFSQKES